MNTRSLNTFSRGLVVRLLILCCIAGLWGWCLTLEYYWATKLLLTLLFGVTVAEIIYYAGNPQQRISSFAESLLFSNDLPILTLPAKDDAELIFRRFVEIVRQIKMEKEAEYELFVATTNHLAVALLVFDRNGRIKLCNNTALQLFRVPSLNHISQIALFSRELADTLMDIQANEQSLVKTELAGRPVKLSVRASHVRFADEMWNIVTLQDIQQEIAQEETEAWQKVIRILAHEIINSTSPINMLIGSLEKIVHKEHWTEVDRQDMETGLQAIGKRSRGMTSFVENYRTMTAIPAPVYSQVEINRLLQRIGLLFREEADAKNISLKIAEPSGIVLQTDERLLEQVLINLVRNAVDATDKPQAYISLNVTCDKQGLLLEVVDNGCGIAPENVGSIFTPFFTTKKAGTGIGLFISRKIMQSLRGSLTVQSVPNRGTVFRIWHPLS